MTGGAQDSGALHRLVGELADALEDAANHGFGEEFLRIHVKELLERARATPAPAGRDWSVSEEWCAYMDDAVSKAPEPLRKLGEYLSILLDEDRWKTVERYLNAAVLSTAPAGWQPEKDDAFTHGYLVAVSSLIGGYGATDYAEYLLQEIGDVSDEDLKRIDLCEYDLENLRPIIASLRSTAPAEGGV